MRTVIASSYTPARGTGRGVRTYGIVRALLSHGPVDLVWVPFGGHEPAPDYAALPGLSAHRVEASRGARRAIAYARHRLGGAPQAVARGASPELLALAGVLSEGADRVIADDISTALALSALARSRPVVYSAHNLESGFREDSDWGSPKRLRDFESRLLARFAEVWMPSRADVREAALLAPGTPVRYVPNVVDVADHPPVRPRGRRAVLVADFTYGPNREGLDWLVQHVLPLVQSDVELLVVGRGLNPGLDLGPRVLVRGFVDDLDDAYAAAACALVPLRTGGGSPLKFVEALARGLPVVATPRAARGLDVVAGTHYLVGDSATTFAAAMDVALTSGQAEAMGRAGRALAEREYSIESLATRLAPAHAVLPARPHPPAATDLP